MVLKGTLVFRFGPNLKLKFWPRPKLNNILLLIDSVMSDALEHIRSHLILGVAL